MNYSCVKLQRLFVLEGVSWRAGQPYTVSGRRISLSLTPDHNGSQLFIACGGAKDDLLQLTGLMAHNAFPKGLRSNVVDFYWLS